MGETPRLHVPTDVQGVPSVFRPQWVLHSVTSEMERFLYSLSDVALFHSKECTTVCAVADWTPFASRVMPVPLAEYGWLGGPCSRVVLHPHAVRDCIMNRVTKRLPCTRVTLHSVLTWNGQTLVHPQPLRVFTHVVYPHSL